MFRIRPPRALRLMAIVLAAGLPAAQAGGQESRATIVGRVIDTSGAAIPPCSNHVCSAILAW